MNFNFNEVKNFGMPYIIAEIGANHNGSMDLAKQLIDQAVDAGAHCVKFQSWTKDSIFSKKVYEDNYFLADDYRDRTDFTLEEIVDEFSFNQDEFRLLKKYADEKKVDFSCTPFSKEEVDFLVHELDIPFIKIASMDLNNLPFLRYIAQKNKPIVLSTGLSTMAEIETSIKLFEEIGKKDIIILHCVSNYPPKDHDVNLRNITMLQNYFQAYAVGFSDHTVGIEIPLASVTLGACMIEKHFTVDKEMFGWDHKASADYNELKQIVDGSRRITAALGSYRRELNEEDYRRMPSYRRSIVAANIIPEGKVIEIDDLDFKRPGTGIEPKFTDFIVGKKAKRTVQFDELIKIEDF